MNIIVDLEDKAIGLLTLWHTEMRETLEIGFSFSPEFTGKGYAAESVTAIFDYLFSQFQIHRIQANCDARNHPSAALCKRAGMRKEAHFIKDFWNKGEWTDSLIFAILKEVHIKENQSQY